MFDGLDPAHGPLFVGIDPGLHGAIAVHGPDGLLHIEDLPTISVDTIRTRHDKADPTAPPKRVKGQKRLLDLFTLRDGLLRLGLRVTMVAVEKVGPMPRDGAISAFTFGTVAGEVRGLLVGLGLPFVEVRPATWKATLQVAKDKQVARVAAQRAWPSAGPLLSRKSDDGRAEALWLASYAQQHHLHAL